MTKLQYINNKLKPFKTGGSIAIIIPAANAKELGIIEDVELDIANEIGKHGKYIVIWNEEQQKKEKQTKLQEVKEDENGDIE